MNLVRTFFDDVLILEPQVFGDARGFFMETWHRERYEGCGIDTAFVQDNLSFSVKNTLRGLHFQITRPQAKLVQAITGEIFDVVLDIRPGSPTFGKWAGVLLSGENRRQMFVPPGFAHGFCVLSESAHFLYKCSDIYVPEDEGGVLWADPDVGVEWPVEAPIVSDKDGRLPRLSEIPPERLFAPAHSR